MPHDTRPKVDPRYPVQVTIRATPGLPSGRRDGTGLVDLAPTVLHHFGVPVPLELDGQSLLDDQPSTVAP